jgi:hypothetical protein
METHTLGCGEIRTKGTSVNGLEWDQTVKFLITESRFVLKVL